MTLEILALMVVAGVAAVVAAVRFSGLSRPSRIADLEHAKSIFAEFFPDEAVLDHLIARDAMAVFLRLEHDRTGLVSSFGSRYVCRIFAPGEARVVRLEEGGLISLRFPDFGFPRGDYRFDSISQARILADWLKGEIDGNDRSAVS